MIIIAMEVLVNLCKPSINIPKKNQAQTRSSTGFPMFLVFKEPISCATSTGRFRSSSH
eukprot:Gb_05388 [translate_table: standard]